MTLGEKICLLRRRHGLTQRALAAALHVHLNTVTYWERGRQRVAPRRYPALATALRVSMQELFADVDGLEHVRMIPTKGSI